MLPIETVACPYCGEHIDLVVDDSVGFQQYVEDCHVCCRPINVSVSVDEEGALSMQVRDENEA
jgi:hypothetical protein